VSITLLWWIFPILVTALAIWLFIPKYSSGMFGDLDVLFRLLICALISAVAWSVCKVIFR
jgi:hypothetical protein